MVVGEVHEEVPVDGGQIVFPFAEVEADVTFDLGTGGRERGWRGKSLPSEQKVSGIGVVAAEEFTEWIGPEVQAGTGDVGWARSDGGDEEMLIEGELIFVVVELAEVLAEPVGEGGVDASHGFAKDTLAEGGTTATGVIGIDDLEAGIVGTGPEGGFAESRVTGDHPVGGVEFGDGLETIEHT